MNEMNYCVYCHVNKQNGRTYVGMTGRNPLDRFDNGYGYWSNKEFYADIQEYGWDNFDHMILEDCLTKAEATKMERIYIEALDAKDPINGYNHIQERL